MRRGNVGGWRHGVDTVQWGPGPCEASVRALHAALTGSVAEQLRLLRPPVVDMAWGLTADPVAQHPVVMGP